MSICLTWNSGACGKTLFKIIYLIFIACYYEDVDKNY